MSSEQLLQAEMLRLLPGLESAPQSQRLWDLDGKREMLLESSVWWHWVVASPS